MSSKPAQVNTSSSPFFITFLNFREQSAVKSTRLCNQCTSMRWKNIWQTCAGPHGIYYTGKTWSALVSTSGSCPLCPLMHNPVRQNEYRGKNATKVICLGPPFTETIKRKQLRWFVFTARGLVFRAYKNNHPPNAFNPYQTLFSELREGDAENQRVVLRNISVSDWTPDDVMVGHYVSENGFSLVCSVWC